jgi:hypothetical protein
MNDPDVDSLFHEYAETVIHGLRSCELASMFPECSQLISDRIRKKPSWQIALPVISCLAAGGVPETGVQVDMAWHPLYLASEILDNVEDKELVPDQLVASPEIATNLATSLIFIAFHSLTAIRSAKSLRRVTEIFARCGFEATYGQHGDLTQKLSPVEKTLDEYWERVILKSGSVFRMATAGGAAAGTLNETIIEALGDYGTALGVMLQIIDDCRDAFSQSQTAITWEVSLPLLLYLLAVGEEDIVFPEITSRTEWKRLLEKVGVIDAISSILQEWKTRALEYLEPLGTSREKSILERSFFVSRAHSLELKEVPMQTQPDRDYPK